MGTVTPNISIYIPSAGETNYDSAFAAGMTNVDQHDHSGAPNKGVPLSSSGIANFSITYQKLNSDVVLAGGGLDVDSGSPNKLKVDGILLPIFQLASNGVICRTSATTVSARTITGTADQITVTNGDGVAGNPTLSIPSTFDLSSSDIICKSITVNGVTAAADATPVNVTLNHNYRTMIQVTNTHDGTGAYAGLHISGSGTQFALMEVMADLYSNAAIAGYCFFNMNTTNGCIWQVASNKVFKWSHGSVSSGTILVLDPASALYPNVDSGSSGSLSCGKNGNRWTEVWAANGTIQTSDESTKTEIVPSPLGLDFILDLVPRKYRLKNGERPHFGFIAQEVKRSIDKFSTDFGGYIDPSVNEPNRDNLLALRYEEFISPIVMAIQELYSKVRGLERQMGGH